MTSKLTRERIEQYANDPRMCNINDEIRELARMALAAMDSEPVAYISKSDFDAGYPHILARRDFNKACTMAVYAAQPAQVVEREPIAWLNDAYLARGVVDGEAGSEDAGPGYIPVYRHAQPAPVVPKEMTAGIAVKHWEGGRGSIESFVAGYNFCRAAMLQASAVCTCPSGDGSLRWPCPVHAGNSPAQSDCCPAQNCIHSAQGVDRPVAWHHSAKSKEGNHGTCCFSYASSHDFGPRYEKPQSQPHYLPERLDYDRALHFLSTEPRKVTPETVIGGNSPVIPDGWTCNDKANAALMMLDRIETADPVDDDRIDGIKRIVCELAAAPHDTPALNSVQSVDSVADRWIPVSERMPDENAEQQVLACFKGGDISTLYYFEGRWDDAYGIVPIRQDVTHWMPLPAAPQEPKP
ncbi:DUF551 domain-containing protein [Klebsiella pneumoniae]|nr:DUF551 domain-containing protein [Klebsiella pneumoniae]